MRLERIRELVRLLPPDYHGDPEITGRSFSDKIASFTEWEDYPDFGRRFVDAFLKSNKNIPHAVREPWLIAYHRMERYKFYNPYVAEACSWRDPARRKYRSVIEALLISDDISFDGISARTCVDPKSLRAYEQLFFNVKDRMGDDIYLSNIAYPGGVTVHLEPNYFINTPYEELLIRAGYTRGHQDVLFFAGMKGQTAAPPDTPEILESAIMTEALRFAQNGGLGQRGLPQITSAKALIVAQKSSGDSGRAPDPTGLSSMGDILRSTLIENSIKNVERVQRRLQSVPVEVEEM